MLSVSVDSYDDLSGNLIFTIESKHGGSWTKKSTISEVEKVIAAFEGNSKYVDCRLPRSAVWNAETIKDIINSILGHLNLDVWRIPELTELLDTAPVQSRLSQCQIFLLAEQVSALQKQHESDSLRISQLITVVDSLSDKLTALLSGTDQNQPVNEVETKVKEVIAESTIIEPCILEQSVVQQLEKMKSDHLFDISRVLQGLSPDAGAKQQIMAVVEFVTGHVKTVCPYAEAYEVSLSCIGCDLPGDTVIVNVITGRNGVGSAFHALSNSFTALLHHLRSNSPQTMSCVVERMETRPIVAGKGGEPVIFLAVSGVPVTITFNEGEKLAFAAVLEETNTLLTSSNDMVKKTLQLVLGWWRCEAHSRPIIAEQVKLLSEHTLLVMVVAVFQQYGGVITSPLDAFYLFLHMISVYDGATQCISVQGVTSIEQRDKVCVTGIPEKALDLLEAISKYKVREVPPVPPPLTLKNVGRSSGLGVTNSSSSTAATELDGESISVANEWCLGASGDEATAGTAGNKSLFRALGFNVVNPLDGSNMVAPMSAPLTAALQSIFRAALESLNACMAAKQVSAFFVTITAAFPCWLPLHSGEVPSMLGTRRGQSENLAALLCERHGYYNLLVRGELTENAIVTVIANILSLKASLPIGEIGSRLVEVTDLNNFSHQLRVKYKGLKHFLEMHPEAFFVSKEHLFNPVIVLRSAVSAEDMTRLESGDMLINEFIAKKKHALRVAALAASPYPSIPAAAGAGASIGGGGAGGGGGGGKSYGAPASAYSTRPTVAVPPHSNNNSPYYRQPSPQFLPRAVSPNFNGPPSQKQQWSSSSHQYPSQIQFTHAADVTLAPGGGAGGGGMLPPPLPRGLGGGGGGGGGGGTLGGAGSYYQQHQQPPHPSRSGGGYHQSYNQENKNYF